MLIVKNLKLTEDIKRMLLENKATFTEVDDQRTLIAETELGGKWSYLYKPQRGALDEKNRIATHDYMPILKGLRDHYGDYIGHIVIDRLLILEDCAWERKEKSSDNSSWKVQIVKTPAFVRQVTGWDYVIKTRRFWTQNMDRAQKAAMIFAELIRINPADGSIQKMTSLSYSILTSTFGANWLDVDAKIPDMSEERIELKGLAKANGQITFDNIEIKQGDQTDFGGEPAEDDIDFGSEFDDEEVE